MEPTAQDAAEVLMTPAALCTYLGDIPPRTLYDWKARGKGPLPLKVGRHLRYRRRDVEAWLEEQAQAARSVPRPAA